MHYDLLIRGGTCVTPWGTEDDRSRHPRRAHRGPRDLAEATAEAVIDAAGLHVLPG